MKKMTTKLRTTGLLAVLLFTLAACSTSARFSNLRPADIVLPKHIKTIVLIDRSQPSKGFNNFVEGLLTGESAGQDYFGRKEVIGSMFHTLSTSPKYDIIPSNIEMDGSKGGNRMAIPLDWKTIEDIAQDFDADAVLAVESYDSDQFTNVDKRTRKRKDGDGNIFYETTYHADRNIDIQMGFRLYDVKKHRIVDEYTARTGVSDSGQGDTRNAALYQLRNNRGLTNRLSGKVGNIYSTRIAPVYVMETRTYFKKGGDEGKLMKKAHRAVKAGDWDRAISSWNKVIALTDKEKTAGKAAYNIAMAHEASGRLDEAMDWARKSYYDHDFKRAEHYISLLDYQLHQKDRLDDQLDVADKVTTVE